MIRYVMMKIFNNLCNRKNYLYWFF